MTDTRQTEQVRRSFLEGMNPEELKRLVGDMIQPKEKGWHIDKNIPISVIIVLLAYGASTAWWAAGMANRVEVLERAFQARIPDVERMVRLDAQMTFLNATVGRLEGKIDGALKKPRTAKE